MRFFSSVQYHMDRRMKTRKRRRARYAIRLYLEIEYIGERDK